METLVTLLMAGFGCACIAAVFAVPVVVVLLVVRSQSGVKGNWHKLRTIYPAHTGPQGEVLKWQSIQVGRVNYNHIATIGIADEGLYVSIWRSTVLIPWHAFTRIEVASMRFPRATMLTIGEPPEATLVVRQQIFERMHARLPQHLMHLS